MPIEKFEDIIAWQKARVLVNEVYRLMKENRDYAFKDQLLRAAVSVMNNIAEGFERRGEKEFKRFLFISKGSNAEVRSMLYLVIDLNYASPEQFQKLYNLTGEIARLLSGFIKTFI